MLALGSVSRSSYGGVVFEMLTMMSAGLMMSLALMCDHALHVAGLFHFVRMAIRASRETTICIVPPGEELAPV